MMVQKETWKKGRSEHSIDTTPFDTGADIHVTPDKRLFIAFDPVEYASVIGVNGTKTDAKVGNLMNLGKCLYVTACHVGVGPCA